MEKNFPIALTFDMDWAPDFAINTCVEILRKHFVPATFFITHRSNVIEAIKEDPNFEIGLHPNFLPGSSHGVSINEVMDTVFGLCPEAICMRTHGLFQTSSLYFDILRQYKQIKYDFSLYLPGNFYLKPCEFYDEKNNSLIRVPYQWEDDLFFFKPYIARDEIVFDRATYQIFDFHPIHVYLNSKNSKNYNLLKENSRCALPQIEEKEARKYINNDLGTFDWLEHILISVARERFVLASSIPSLIT